MLLRVPPRRHHLRQLPVQLHDTRHAGCGRPHVEPVDEYLAAAQRTGSPIVAVFETHVQADHVSGLPDLVAHRRHRLTCPPAPESRSRTPLADTA